MLGLKMFASELKLLALGLGVLIVPLQFVAADLQILESAFQQLEFLPVFRVMGVTQKSFPAPPPASSVGEFSRCRFGEAGI